MEVFWHTLFYMTSIVMKLIHNLHTEARKSRPKYCGADGPEGANIRPL
eukprot:SAG22_NODE_708_length_7748_cov_3.772650_1_plen_48_part_00